jgi:hypothetical protein
MSQPDNFADILGIRQVPCCNDYRTAFGEFFVVFGIKKLY